MVRRARETGRGDPAADGPAAGLDAKECPSPSLIEPVG